MRFFLFLGLSLSLIANASEKAPEFLSIYSPDEESSLSMKCNGEKPFNQIECDFQQISLRSYSDEEISNQLKERMAEFKDASLKDLDDSYKFCKDFEQQYKKSISEANEIGWNRNKIEEFKRDLESKKPLCECWNSTNIPLVKDKKSCYLSALEKGIRYELDVCKISSNNFTFNLKKSGTNKWTSDPVKSGLCNVSTIVTIERDSKSEYLWTYYQSRVQTGEVKDATCKAMLASKPVQYSWRGGNRSAVKCSSIQFGI